MADSRKYIHLRTLNNASFEELVVARLRAEGIDFRVRNAMTATIYPLNNMGVSLEVEEADYELAQEILAAMDLDASRQPADIDHSDADHKDIEFEKQIYEHEQKLENAKPPYFTFLMIVLICLIGVYFIIKMRY